jgi:hypothetical protein
MSEIWQAIVRKLPNFSTNRCSKENGLLTAYSHEITKCIIIVFQLRIVNLETLHIIQ